MLPPAKLDEGWRVVSRPQSGYSIGIPPGWSVLDFDQLGISSGPVADFPGTLFSHYSKSNSSIIAMGGNLLEPTFMVLAQTHQARPESAKEEVNRALRVLQRRGSFMKVADQRVDLPVGTAFRVLAQDSAQEVTNYRRLAYWYVLTDGKETYTAFFFAEGRAEVLIPTKQIMGTFRITKTELGNPAVLHG